MGTEEICTPVMEDTDVISEVVQRATKKKYKVKLIMAYVKVLSQNIFV
jgi:hypothetical protein